MIGANDQRKEPPLQCIDPISLQNSPNSVSTIEDKDFQSPSIHPKVPSATKRPAYKLKIETILKPGTSHAGSKSNDHYLSGMDRASRVTKPSKRQSNAPTEYNTFHTQQSDGMDDELKLVGISNRRFIKKSKQLSKRY